MKTQFAGDCDIEPSYQRVACVQSADLSDVWVQTTVPGGQHYPPAHGQQQYYDQAYNKEFTPMPQQGYPQQSMHNTLPGAQPRYVQLNRERLTNGGRALRRRKTKYSKLQ